MLSSFQRDLLGDLQQEGTYGTPLIGWCGQKEIFRSSGAPTHVGALTAQLSNTFVEETYFLVRTIRAVRVYRGYETQGLTAPYGRDISASLVASRTPGTPDGLWWTPARPTLAIENMGLPSEARETVRAGTAIIKEWNRLDYYLEAELKPFAYVYVGRACPQQEKAIYGGRTYRGGNFQFRLTEKPETAFSSMQRYAAL